MSLHSVRDAEDVVAGFVVAGVVEAIDCLLELSFHAPRDLLVVLQVPFEQAHAEGNRAKAVSVAALRGLAEGRFAHLSNSDQNKSG
jgi:hypothetical protein